MKWNINSASIIGRDHELTKKNKQDFVCSFVSDNFVIGVVCDGCGESQYSEVGASLIGTFVLNYFKLYTKHLLRLLAESPLKARSWLIGVGVNVSVSPVRHRLMFRDMCGITFLSAVSKTRFYLRCLIQRLFHLRK